jgi:hypothetical protein
MLTKASAIRSEVRTNPRASVGECAGSTGGLVRTLAVVGLACLGLPGPAQAQSVVAWGVNYSGQCNVPALPSGLTYVQIAAGGAHTVALRSDGFVVAWGDNWNGQCNVQPANLRRDCGG